MDFKETRRLRGHVGAVLCARYTKDGAYARAYDLARRLQLRESLDLARRIAASHGEDALTARVEDLIAVADGVTGDEDAMDEENVAPEAPKEES